VNPSQVGAASYIGLNLVVGITKPVLREGDEGFSNYNVSIVSPVYRPLTTTAIGNKTVAVCSSGKAAWVYYLSGTEPGNTELKEYRLDTFAPSTHLGTTRIARGSSLAAYWHPEKKRRYVIYQDANSNNLYEFLVEENDADHVQNSTDAQKGTTIAVTYCDKKVYLYYTDGSYNLRRIVKTNDKWGSSTFLEGTDKLDPSSQLTVATANGINHLFYIQDGETEGDFTHVRDAIDGIS